MPTQLVRQHLQKFSEILPVPIVTMVLNEYQFAKTLPEDPIFLPLVASGASQLDIFVLAETPVRTVHTRFVILREGGKTTLSISEFVGSVLFGSTRLFLFTIEPPVVANQ